ncbi:hypothetical protein [uncultured Roseibium sp.]|uniref:hypothetical protein n=1 Tax=uncultured Roseibium sp. TaxID=1936171 RepID=UPI003216389A
MSNFIEQARESILGDWDNFDSIIRKELFNKQGTVPHAKYKSIRSALRRKVETESEKQHNYLKAFVDQEFALKEVNRHLYFVLFDFCIESLMFIRKSRTLSKFEDMIPTEYFLGRMTEILQREKVVRGKHGSYIYWMAVLHYLNNNHAESFRLFPLADSFPPEQFVLDRYMIGSRTVIPNIDHVLNKKTLIEFDEELNFEKREPLGSEELVLLTCADEIYFDKLGDIYLSSFSNLTKNVRLHIHIMRKSDKPLNLDKLKNWEGLKIDVTSSDATPYHEKSWFTVARWLLLPALLKAYEKPVLVTDFDVSFDPEGFSNYVDVARGFDIALNINKFPSNYMPWNTINANQVFVNNTELGALFSSALRDVSLRWYDVRRGDQWWIDQNILYACYRDLMRSCHSMKVMNNFKYPTIKRIVKEKKEYLEGGAKK